MSPAVIVVGIVQLRFVASFYVGEEIYGVVKFLQLSDGAKFDNFFIAEISFSSFPQHFAQQVAFQRQSVTKVPARHTANDMLSSVVKNCSQSGDTCLQT